MHIVVRTHARTHLASINDIERMFNDFNSLFRYTFHGKSIEFKCRFNKHRTFHVTSFFLHSHKQNSQLMK